MEKQVIETLIEMGVPADVNGFRYITQAICMYEEDEKAMKKITNLYRDIAVRNDVTASSVERAIRHAIENVQKNGNKELVDKYLGPSKSNATVLSTMYYKLKMEKQNKEEIPMDDTAKYYMSECIRLRTERDMYKKLYEDLVEKLEFAS